MASVVIAREVGVPIGGSDVVSRVSVSTYCMFSPDACPATADVHVGVS